MGSKNLRSSCYRQVIHNQQGQRYSRSGISTMFCKSKDKVSVKYFHFHDIRAKSLTDGSQQGGDVQKLAGHESDQMTEHYIKR